MDAFYQNETDFLKSLPADEVLRFESWMNSLEGHMKSWHQKTGNLPYDLPLSKSTGLECWHGDFIDGMMPLEAFSSDQENWD